MQQYSRQHVMDVLNRLGYPHLAEEVPGELPDPADINRIAAWLMKHGLTRDELVNQMGGSP
ncbi:MAG TPA: hypothetical protein VMU95_22820 [Trebonia sp.]|nr:hypothetical protein [Trebonia sp.]